MFENYNELSAEEKVRVKAAFLGIRKDYTYGDRVRILAWAFVRGFKYRRVERTTRAQVLYDGSVLHHNKPDAYTITQLLAKHLPEFDAEFAVPANPKAHRRLTGVQVANWLADESGAIPAPVRVKKAYVAAS